jgi:hypothetical protein
VRSILNIDTPAATSNLTTLVRVKQELDITDGTKDVLLTAKIREASSDCEAYLGYRVAGESVTETIWHEPADMEAEFIVLRRYPNIVITSVTVDDVLLDPSRYRLDPETGQLWMLNDSGMPMFWLFSKSVIIVYAAGYILPGAANSNLPAGIEGACVELVSDFWLARGRDPSVKSETEPGVYQVDYWVGSVGEEGELPPRVQMKLAPFRRAKAA